MRTPYRVRGRLFRDWDDASPGFVEVDTVAHCGPTVEGFHLWTVTAVDVATRWVEMDVGWGKTQERVGAAIRRMHRRLPVPLLGLDSDNGSEFINRGLYSYCEENGITFTKSRPYRENDSAHVERKKVYSLARLHVNFFQPVRRLTGRSGHGARVIRQHDEASTPYQRMLSSRAVSRTKQMLLEKMYLSLNPLWLSRQIDAENDKLLGMAWRQGKPLSRNTAGNRNCEVNSLAR